MRSRLLRRAGGCVLPALAACSAAAQSAAEPPFNWGASAGVLHRTLTERADDGSRLVRESGPLLRLQLDGTLRLAHGGALRVEAGAAGGRLDYEGRTQGGAPLQTRTRHRDLDFSLGWRPLAPAAWGEGWLVLRALQQRRDIAATATVGALRETSFLVSPGLRWQGRFDAAGWRLQPGVEARISTHHRLEIDYGGVFDRSDLDGGRRRELVLAVDAARGDSPWHWQLAWTHTRQVASDRQALARAGAVVGSVRQPETVMNDVLLSVRRAF